MMYKNHEHCILLTRRWIRGFVITVAVGVVTETVIRLPLFIETFAFFFEAIFLVFTARYVLI